MLTSRFLNLARKSLKAVGDVCMSPTALFFSNLCLKVSYSSKISKPEKGHDEAVGHKHLLYCPQPRAQKASSRVNPMKIILCICYPSNNKNT